jgi:hypothetical protein
MSIQGPANPTQGKFYWVQVGTATENAPPFFPNVTQAGCDTVFPYNVFSNGDPTHPEDTAKLIVYPPVLNASVSETFNMWMLFKSNNPNSIYVPIAVGTWSFQGEINYDEDAKAWLQAAFAPTQFTAFKGTDTLNFPSWSSTIQPLKPDPGF